VLTVNDSAPLQIRDCAGHPPNSIPTPGREPVLLHRVDEIRYRFIGHVEIVEIRTGQ
jgi:hypothetical protein